MPSQAQSRTGYRTERLHQPSGPTATSSLLQAVLPLCIAAWAVLAASPTSIQAHSVQTPARAALEWSWSWEPGALVPLLLFAWLYGCGLYRLWSHAGIGHGARPWQVAAFVGGWAALSLALLSPLDQLSTHLFAAHMLQHTILMLLAAPLLVLSQPLLPCLWGFPLTWRRRLGRCWRQWSAARTVWHLLTEPGVAWTLQAVFLWGWHMPALYQAALRSTAVHALQHLSFVVGALLFWWALCSGKHGHTGYGIGVLALFTTGLHSSLLGALLTLAPRPWYAAYTTTTLTWGLGPLQDQQLAGLIMWIPSGLFYTIAGLTFLGVWLQETRTTRNGTPRRAERQETMAALTLAPGEPAGVTRTLRPGGQSGRHHS
ncbi:MAG: cytochrome c oxidase assembly protein [Candidatus Tectimicrobiota bacterium]